MKLEQPKNKNYSAVVVELKHFNELPNCNNVKGAVIFNNQVIVGKDVTEGSVGLFFPLETALSKEFLGANNLYRKPEWGNKDPQAKGFFEESGRVKAVRFRGHASEGFWIPLNSLDNMNGVSSEGLKVGNEFDTICGVEICRKYVPRSNKVKGNGGNGVKDKKAKTIHDYIIDGQFRFHPDTENLRRNVHKVDPYDLISITDKWHGTSVVVANVLTKRNLKWYEKLLKKLGVDVVDTEYGIVASSRRVIKTIDGETQRGGHFYGTDVWGLVAKEVNIPRGFTIYGEIVGYTPEGRPIQKGYTYNVPPKSHELRVYRVTLTTPEGEVLELSWPQVEQFCRAHNLLWVNPFFYGTAEEIEPYVEGSNVTEWHPRFLAALEAKYVDGHECPYNKGYPAEGIVVRIDRLTKAEAYKLKSFAFLEAETKALDSGDVGVEEEEESNVTE